MGDNRNTRFPENNPYNFVPGDTPIKEKAQTKSLSKFGGLSGSINCLISNEAPLMIGGKRYENTEPKKIDFFKIDGKPAIPGTSLKGMVRSVLEAVTNSCFAIFDEGRLDYRETDIASKLKAGQVTHIQNGRGSIKTMERGWIAMQDRSNTVSGKQRGAPRSFKLASVPEGTNSGDRVWIKYVKIDEYRNSRRRPVPGPFYLIADISSTKKPGYTEGIYKITGRSIGNKKRERIFFSTGRSAIYSFSKEEAEDYNDILEHQKERQKNRHFKLLKTNNLSINSLVYFMADGREAKSISRVEVPRIKYEKSRRDLLPDEYRACKDSSNLCAACRLFGFVSKDKETADEAIAGRVSFSDAIHAGGSGEMKDYQSIKVLGTPHPTSYNFYLIDPSDPKTVRNYDGSKVISERGKTDSDQKGEVEIRGRKFYYHNANSDDMGKYLHSGDSPPARLRSQVKPVLRDNIFRFKIRFRNLSKFELGMLLYCLKLEGNLRHKLGMGKPIGFGTVKIVINSMELVEDPKSQYLEFTNTSPKQEKKEINSYVEHFKAQVTELAGKPFDQLLNIQKLKIILDPLCAPDDIGYPSQGFEWYGNNRNMPLPPL